MKLYELEIVPEAEAELKKEARYSARKWGKYHASEYSRALWAKIASLKENPFFCPIREDIMDEVRVMNFKGNKIVYAVIEKEKMVVVLAILSSHQEINTSQIKARYKNQ